MGSPQQPQATPGLLGAPRSLTKRARTAGSTELFATSDRYDELPASVIGKSLYQSNNLEQFRSHAERAANEYSHPKVIYTVRSELLSAEDARVRNGYVPWFLPIESENAEMDDEDEVPPPLPAWGHANAALACLTRPCGCGLA